ncbi:MAG: EamA family transporter [Chloroflexi bacterium]|nr:EamA family transporter [Chloroflexota bacterium]
MSLGIVFALAAAVAFGFNGATVRRGVATAAASQGLYVTVLGGLVLFVLTAAASGQLFRAGEVAVRDYGFLVAGGLVHILAGRYCNFRAIAAMGANRVAPVMGSSAFVSVLIAVLFLDETVTLRIGVGIALVMVGPALVARRRTPVPATPAGASGDAPAGDAMAVANSPNLKEGYLFGIMGAVLWGMGPVLMRAGVDSTGLGILGGLVTYGAAATVLVLILAVPGQLAKTTSLDRSALRWFALSTLNSFIANVFRFSALAIAPVTVVVPMIRTFAIFQLGFNFLINRSLESFEPRILAAIAVSVAGAVLIAT